MLLRKDSQLPAELLVVAIESVLEYFPPVLRPCVRDLGRADVEVLAMAGAPAFNTMEATVVTDSAGLNERPWIALHNSGSSSPPQETELTYSPKK